MSKKESTPQTQQPQFEQLAHLELLAPAGSFASAVAALESGADAVYLGLEKFSARGGATNFTIDQIARLITATKERAKKIPASRPMAIYLAINTVIQESEIAQLTPILYELQRLRIDGIIVQDLGVAKLVEEIAPNIPLHGSTQMGVHSIEGAQTAWELGFRRVVLARELGIGEIAEIHKAVPEIELEVFIHGAMCYSVSGSCLASGLLLGRSANRGICGQVCRTWFSNDTENGYFFSLKDRCTGADISKLIDAGVTSFKIEGRMKSPAYVQEVVSLYREALEKGAISKKRAGRVATIWNRAPLVPSASSAIDRSPTPSGNAITKEYAGHRGVPGARVVEKQKESILIEALETLSLRDGILWFTQSKDSSQDLPSPQKGSIRSLTTPKGKRTSELRPGEYGVITLNPTPVKGAIIYKISTHDQQVKEAQPKSYKPYRPPLQITLYLDTTDPEQPKLTIATLPGEWISYKESFTLEGEPLEEVRAVEKPLRDTIGRGSELFQGIIQEITGVLELSKAISRSTLKQINRAWVAGVEEEWQKIQNTPLKELTTTVEEPVDSGERLSVLPKRPEGLLPFITDPKTIAQSCYTKENATGTPQRWIPLAPVLYKEQGYYTALEEALETSISEGILPIIGINNIGQLHWIKPWVTSGRVEYFLDYHIYTANRWSVRKISDYLQRPPISAYFWIEGSQDSYKTTHSALSIPLLEVEKSLKVPLFISRSCYAKEVLGIHCESCKRATQHYTIEQNSKAHTIYIEDCITYLIEKS